MLYGVGVVVLSSAAGLLARAATRRWTVIRGTAGGAAVLLLALAVFVES